MIRIITDGTCDINQERAEKLGIDVMPLTIHFGEENYIQNVTMTTNEFYEKLSKTKELPTTSQVNPFEFERIFRKYTDAGDEVIGIFISHYLSGTYQSAVLAKETIRSDKIHVIDSLTATVAMGLLIEEAVHMRDDGASASEIVGRIKALIPKVRFVSAVDTLDYLRLGGRISSTTAFLGGILGINPIVCVMDGKVEAIGKARGKKACFQFLLNKYKEECGEMTDIAFAHSHAPERMYECIAYFKENVTLGAIIQDEMGPIVGTHIGPNCVGIAYFL